MKKCRISILVSCIAAFAFMATKAESADISANETAKEPMAVEEQAAHHPWNASVDLAWFPDSDVRKTGGKISMQEVAAVFGRSYALSPEFTLSTAIAYSLRKLDAPDSARLPDELHTLSVEFCGDYQLNKNTILTLLVSPGLSGDFKEIGADDIRTAIGIMGQYTITAKLTLLAGLIYQQGYESFPVSPIIGAIYRLDEQWTLGLGAPRSGVTYSPNRTSSYSIGVEFGGSEYQLHDASLGAKKISYGDFRAVAGAEYILFSAIRVNIAGGYAFERKFEFYDGSRDDVNIDNAPFARIGVSLAW